MLDLIIFKILWEVLSILITLFSFNSLSATNKFESIPLFKRCLCNRITDMEAPPLLSEKFTCKIFISLNDISYIKYFTKKDKD